MTPPNERIHVDAEPFDPEEEAGFGGTGPSGGDRQGPRPGRQRTSRGSGIARLLGMRYGTVLAGALLDAVDFTTMGPIGVKFGFFIGAGCGWWLSRELGYPKRLRIGIAVACGLYCMFPPTSILPVATVLGALARQLGWAPDQQEE